MTLDFKKYADKFLFVNNDTKDGDVYYCDCGEIFIKNSNDEELKKELADTGDRIRAMDMDEEMHSEFQDIYKGVKLGTEEDVRCPQCSRNFQTSFNKQNFVANNVPFISGYSFKEVDDSVILLYSVIKPNLISLKSRDYTESVKILRFEKSSKKLFYKDFESEEIEFDLDDVIRIVNDFFVFETSTPSTRLIV